MAGYRVQPAAARRIDDIYIYTRDHWGDAQAEHYVRGLFARFQDIADHKVRWRDIPADLGVSGFYGRYERHYIYCRMASSVSSLSCTSACTGSTGCAKPRSIER